MEKMTRKKSLRALAGANKVAAGLGVASMTVGCAGVATAVNFVLFSDVPLWAAAVALAASAGALGAGATMVSECESFEL